MPVDGAQLHAQGHIDQLDAGVRHSNDSLAPNEQATEQVQPVHRGQQVEKGDGRAIRHEMAGPNNEVITANKIHRPTLAGGRLNAPSASTSSRDPGVSHGLAVSLLASRPQTTTPARRATNATARLTT